MLEFTVNLIGRFLLSRSSLWNKIMAFPGHVVIIIGGSGSSSRNVVLVAHVLQWQAVGIKGHDDHENGVYICIQ